MNLDAQRITQAWLQLVANAVKFTEPGDVVAIGSWAGGGVVRAWVRDSGPGVQSEDMERIFQRFHRGESGRGTDGSGPVIDLGRGPVE